MRRHTLLVRLLVAGWLAATPAWAATDGWSFTVRAENDLPVNSDRYYTNGVTSWIAWGREFDAQPRRAEFGAVAFSVFR